MCLKNSLSIFFFAHFYPSITLLSCGYLIQGYKDLYSIFVYRKKNREEVKEWWAKVVVCSLTKGWENVIDKASKGKRPHRTQELLYTHKEFPVRLLLYTNDKRNRFAASKRFSAGMCEQINDPPLRRRLNYHSSVVNRKIYSNQDNSTVDKSRLQVQSPSLVLPYN
jgi:hypothetical protein